MALVGLANDFVKSRDGLGVGVWCVRECNTKYFFSEYDLFPGDSDLPVSQKRLRYEPECSDVSADEAEGVPVVPDVPNVS